MTGYVYFLRDLATDLIKIGTSRYPKNRINAIRTSAAGGIEVIGVIVGGREVEQALHEEFSEEHERLEWFRPSLRLIARIDLLLAERGVASIKTVREQTRCEHTRQCAEWIDFLEMRLSQRLQKAKADCRGDLAQEIGITPGLVYNLKAGRILKISVQDYEKIRLAYINRAEENLAFLIGELTNIKSILVEKGVKPETRNLIDQFICSDVVDK